MTKLERVFRRAWFYGFDPRDFFLRLATGLANNYQIDRAIDLTARVIVTKTRTALYTPAMEWVSPCSVLSLSIRECKTERFSCKL